MEASGKSRQAKSDKKKKSGVRTKFLIESLRNDYYSLREENERLKELVSANLPNAEEILSTCYDLNANKAKPGSIDELAGKMSLATDDEDEDDDVGF